MTTATMDRDQTVALMHRFTEAWNSGDPERVLACYAEDARYRDPNTRGEVEGGDALRGYLVKLFSAWRMHWTLTAVHPLAEGGAAIRWRGVFGRVGSDADVELDGMELVLVRGERIARNDIHFDRAALASLGS